MTNKISGKALITGASGFIGKRLHQMLLGQNVDVFTLRRKGSPIPQNGHSVMGDYRDIEGLTRLLEQERPDYIFHVAGSTKGRDTRDFFEGNVMPTKNLLEAVKKSNIPLRRFLHVSSLTAYGPSKKDQPKRETDPREPVEAYGQSKLQAEQVVESFSEIPWTIIRPSGVYGPGDVDYLQLFRLAQNRINLFFGNKDRWFSAVYVDDCARSMIEAAVADNTLKKGYFICDGLPITWGGYQQEILSVMNQKAVTIHLPETITWVAAYAGDLVTSIDGKPRLMNKNKAIMGVQEAWTCTHEAAAADFLYKPEFNLSEGIKNTLRWYQEKGWVR